MDTLARVISLLKTIVASIETAYSSGIRRKEAFRVVDRCLDELSSLMKDDLARSAVDDALGHIHVAIGKFEQDHSAKQLISGHAAEFVKFEMQLHYLLGMRRKELATLLNKVRRNLESGRVTPSKLNATIIPRTGKQLLDHTRLRVDKTKADLAATERKPRKAKKQMKKNAFARFYLGTFGTGMAIGNVLLGLPSIGLSAPISVASMAAGALSLGAAVFDDRELLKSLSKSNSTSESESKSPVKVEHGQPEEMTNDPNQMIKEGQEKLTKLRLAAFKQEGVINGITERGESVEAAEAKLHQIQADISQLTREINVRKDRLYKLNESDAAIHIRATTATAASVPLSIEIPRSQ